MPFAAISAIASIGGGIAGAVGASNANSSSRSEQKKADKLAKKQANITNKYNLESAAAVEKDYFAARQFQYDTAVRQWQYDTEIQDFRYLQDVKKYGVSVDNYQNQLAFNTLGAQQAYESQQASYNELLASTAFEGQASLVENLQNTGRASLGQAGNSRVKAMQSTLAEQGRNAAIMSASLISGEREFQRGMQEVGLQKYGSDLQAAANLMIRPEALPEILKPVMGPERTFVKPAEVLPGAVPPAQYTNPLMPLIGGISSAASTAAQFKLFG
ncbi:MAG: hypothetical protein ACPLGZ_00680 [Candidatus Pelagibacter ubique]